MSKGYQTIAAFLTQYPNDVAIQSITAIADRCSAHASQLVRFAQSLGYKGFKDLQILFQRRLATAAPGFDARGKALESELHNRTDRSEFGLLQELVVKDVASLQRLLDEVRQADLARAVDTIVGASTIFLLGQLRSAPVVELLRYLLTMLGVRCVMLDPGAGLATHIARTMRTGDVLIAVSFRFYATEVVNIVDDVGSRGIPIIAISDSTLSPLARHSRVLFAVPEPDYPFSRSLAAPMCLAQALVVAVAARLQPGDTTPRIPTVTSS
jgi:DNA-binding MurR/RpiR family transcriptional regulator